MKEKDAVLTLWNNITRLIDEKILYAYYDKTFPSVIYGKNKNGTYKIVKEGVLYDVPNSLGFELKVGQSVWVTMPCGQKELKSMHISGIRGDNKGLSTVGELVDVELTRKNIIDALGYTPCSPTDINDKFTKHELETDWKESVDTYNDIFITYQNPDIGWTVNVRDTGFTYIYNGTEWEILSSKVSRITNEEIDSLFK